MTEADILYELQRKTLIPVRVLHVSSDPELAAELRRILSRTNWLLYQAQDDQQAAALLTSNPVSVLISDQSASCGSWRRVFEELGRTVTAPRWVACVPSNNVDGWTEAASAGADDIVGVPFNPKEVYAVISNAHLAWLNPAFRTAAWTPYAHRPGEATASAPY